MAEGLPVRGGDDGAGDGAGWADLVARYARAGDARRLTGQVLGAFPDLRLVDVVGVIPAACAAGMPSPAPGQCQTLDAGLAAIDVRGPGWVDRHYPIAVVVPELAEAGFDAAHIVALFNGNVPIDQLGPSVASLFPDYVPDVADEAIGPRIIERWRCSLRCCQPEPGRFNRWVRAASGRLSSRPTSSGTAPPALGEGPGSSSPATSQDGPAEPPRHRSANVMRPNWARVGSVEAQAAQAREFLDGAILPGGLTLFRPTTGPPSASAAVDLSVPAMLIILVDAEDIDEELRAVFDARAAEANGLTWGESLRGQVGWTTLATVTGDPRVDAKRSFAKLNLDLSFAKLNLDLTAPMRYKASFAFHLAQTSGHVGAVAGAGGLVAFAMPELVGQLGGLTMMEAMDSLPCFILPAAPQLASLLTRLGPPG